MNHEEPRDLTDEMRLKEVRLLDDIQQREKDLKRKREEMEVMVRELEELGLGDKPFVKRAKSWIQLCNEVL